MALCCETDNHEILSSRIFLTRQDLIVNQGALCFGNAVSRAIIKLISSTTLSRVNTEKVTLNSNRIICRVTRGCRDTWGERLGRWHPSGSTRDIRHGAVPWLSQKTSLAECVTSLWRCDESQRTQRKACGGGKFDRSAFSCMCR